MSTTWSLDLPRFKTADKVAQKPIAKTATTITKTNTTKPNNIASAMLAADLAVALSVDSGKRITTGEALSISTLPLQKLAPRRKKI